MWYLVEVHKHQVLQMGKSEKTCRRRYLQRRNKGGIRVVKQSMKNT